MKGFYGEKIEIHTHALRLTHSHNTYRHTCTETENLEKLVNCCIIYRIFLVENKEHNIIVYKIKNIKSNDTSTFFFFVFLFTKSKFIKKYNVVKRIRFLKYVFLK